MNNHILDDMSHWNEVGYSLALETQILERDDPELAYRFACEMSEANLERVEPIVLACQDPRLIYDFALLKSERGGEIDLLEQRILGCDDPGLMILFAIDVEGSDHEAFRERLAIHPDPKFLHLFELELKNHGYE